MKARWSLAIAVLEALGLPVGLARADNGLHGGYTATTDACVGCHRARTAAAGKLLLDTTPNLCYTCHGNAGAGAVGYGLTGSFATAADYQSGCGECHPADPGRRQDGMVNALLSPAGAPAGSLESRNATTVAYAGGTCSGVYCHSGIQITSGPVGMPLIDGSDHYVLDPHGNLYAYNMSFEPLSCRTCHYGEIAQANTWTRNGMGVTTYDAVPLASKVDHTNGQRNVTFDTINPIVYNGSGGPVTYSLAGAAYDPAERSCSDVGCHKLQTYVQWGTPYRWWTNECDLCHRYGASPSPNLALVQQPQGHSGEILAGQS